MATKQVIAYFVNDQERTAALAALEGAYATDSFVLGSIDEESIPALREQGLIVQEQHDAAAVSDRQQAFRAIHMSAFGFNTQPSAADELAVPQDVDYYRVFLKGPLLEEWRQQLESAGA